MKEPSDEQFDKTLTGFFEALADNEELLETLELAKDASYGQKLELLSRADEVWVDSAIEALKKVHPQTPLPDEMRGTIETLLYLSITMNESDLLKIDPKKMQERRQQSE